MATSSNATNNDANEKYDLFISYEWGLQEWSWTISIKAWGKWQSSTSVARLSPLETNNESLYLQLGQQIRRSCVFLFMLTRAYTKSDMCKRELVYAAKLGKAIFCFMLEKLTPDEIGDEIGFIMGNCVYIQNTTRIQSQRRPRKTCVTSIGSLIILMRPIRS